MAEILLRPHEFSQDVGIVPVKYGQTIAQMLAEANQGADYTTQLEVRVGGHVVPVEMWDRVRPKEGAVIHVTRLSLAGGGTRQIIGAIAMIALTYFTFGAGAVAGWSLGTASVAGTFAVQASVYMLGSLAINALTKPPSLKTDGEQSRKWNALTGTSNQANPYGVIPLVIGESRFYPPHAAVPYTQSVGEDSYQICLFDLGHGEIDVVPGSIRIGDTPLSSYTNVSYEITRNPTLYKNDVAEISVMSSLNEVNDTATRTTSSNITRISLDLVATQGLYGVGNTGKKFVTWVKFRIEYRAVGASTWLTPATPQLSYLTKAGSIYEARRQHAHAYACGIAWDVPAGQYEVRVIRDSEHTSASHNTHVYDFTWTVLRSIKNTAPSTTGTTKLAMRIKATDQLNGTLQSLSLVVRQKVRVYDRGAGTWSAPQFSINPAWVAYWLLTECPAFSRHVTPNRIHLDTFADYAEWCDARSFEARGVLDAATTAGQLVEDVLACSLGSLGKRDGKYSIVYDSGETLPSMVFTPMEIEGFTMSRPFLKLPQALRVQFKNPDADYQEDEIVVVDDGYSYRGVDARGNPSSLPEPERFETLQLQYAQDAIHAWRVGRFHLAQGKFRPETYAWESDIAGLGTTRGDVVQVSTDVVEWGIGWGRIIAINVIGGNAELMLDQDVVAEPGKTYAAQIRRDDGSSVLASIPDLYGTTHVIQLSGVPTGLHVGDVCIIGEASRVSEKMLITSVRYTDGGNRTQFTAVRYSPAVAPYWSNPPASITSEITGNVYSEVPIPVITGVISDQIHGDPDDAGIIAPGITISVGKPADQAMEIYAQEIR
jgi:hypothetical protein